MARRHGYLVVDAADLDRSGLNVCLAARPTFGIGLSKRTAAACELGNLDARGADLLEAARETVLPPIGARLVIARTDLASLASAAWLDLRAFRRDKPGRGRVHDLCRSLRRSPDLCARLRGDDLSLFDDTDPSLVRAVLCNLCHDPRLPLHYRVDTVAAMLRRGVFLGQPHATRQLRRRMERLQAQTKARPSTGTTPTTTTTDDVPANLSSPRTTTSAVVTHPAPPTTDIAAALPSQSAADATIGSCEVAATPSSTAAVGRCAIEPDQLRQLIVADANLYAAWERVRDNARSRGTWSPALRRFEKELAARLARLSERLLDGSWTPSPLAHVPIKKDSGGVRHLHIPPVADRVVERAITQIISQLIDPHLSAWSYAFRPGRGVRDAVREVAYRRDDGATHVARFDIVDCFSSIDHTQLRAGLVRYLDDPWLNAVVDRLLARDLPGIPRQQPLTGVAQGAPLSPLLANIVLEELDMALYDAGFPPIRYADDLAVPVLDAEHGATALQVAQDRAAAMGLAINPTKAAVVAFTDVVRFLGELIGPDHPTANDADEAPLPNRRTLYLTARTGQVHLRRGQIRAMAKDGEQLVSVPVSGVERIVVMGPANVSAGLRSYAFNHDLEVLFLSRNGTFLGRYDGGCEVEPKLRRRQYELLDDDPGRVAIARGFAAGKIANQRALLLRYRRGVDDVLDDGGAVDALSDLHAKVLRATTTDQVMGYEGAATKRYHRALVGLFPAEAGFRRRTKRPPKDPANAALSFGYMLLTGEAHAACAGAGLDPQVGLLHASGRHRAALAFDLVEEFRPLIIDSIVVAGFRRGRFPADRFRKGDKDAVLLNDRGRRALIEQYESRMLSRYRSARSGVRHSYRSGLREQARHLAEVIAGREPAYQPVGWR